VTLLPLQATDTTLTTYVPPLAKDSQSAWYAGPVTLCVQTDTHESCAPNSLTVQQPVSVSGTPGTLLSQFVAATQKAVLDSVTTTGNSAQITALQRVSVATQANLSAKIASALAGNPQTVTVTLPNGQTVTASFDLTTIRNLESLLAAGQPQLNSTIVSMRRQARKSQQAGLTAATTASSAITEAYLTNQAALYQGYNRLGQEATLTQLGIGGAALATCILLPEACLDITEAIAASAPVFEATAAVQIGAMLAIDLGPSRLQTLYTQPAANLPLTLWQPQTLGVQGTFVSTLNASDGPEALVTYYLSMWVSNDFAGLVPPSTIQSVLNPALDLIAQAILSNGLDATIQSYVSNILPPQQVSLSWNTVGSNCITGSSYPPSVNLFYFMDDNWTFFPLQPTPSLTTCNFIAQDNLLWLGDSAPSTALGVTVMSGVPSTCAAFPFPSGMDPFSSIYYVSAAAPNGDRVVLGDPALQLWESLTGVTFFPSFIPQLPLPALSNEAYCQPVSLAPACTAAAYVPSAAERSGNFSAFPVKLTDPASNTPFPNNEIPLSRMGPGGVFGWRVQSAQGCGAPQVTSVSDRNAFIAGTGPNSVATFDDVAVYTQTPFTSGGVFFTVPANAAADLVVNSQVCYPDLFWFPGVGTPPNFVSMLSGFQAMTTTVSLAGRAFLNGW
jgi:hypothetical protein